MAMNRLFGKFMPKLLDPPEELVENTVERAAGNPGSLRQLCALLTESGVVDTTREPWTADMSKLTALDIPASVADTLKARLDRLDPRDQALLRYAAVIGEVFWDGTVVALARQRFKHRKQIGAANIWTDDSDVLTVSSTLERLVARQFIVRIPDMDIKDCMKYAFVRSGIREQILEGMNPKEMKRDHYLVAEWLSHATGESNPQFAALEAHHWENAGEPHRAALALFRAARDARMRYRNEKAAKLFQKGLDLCDKRDRLVLIDALHDIGSVYDLAGQYEAAEMYFTEMLRHAWTIVHRGKAGAAFNKIGRLYRARGDSTAARAFLERGMALFKAADDEKGVAACLGDLGELARRRGAYDRAFVLVSEALELQRKMDNKPSIAVCLHSLGHIEAARSLYSQAERYLEEAFELRSQAQDKGGMAQTLSTLAVVLFNKGALEGAIARWEAALNLAEEVGDRRMLAIVHNNLGEAHRDLGNHDLAMKHFEACEKVVTKLDDRLLYAEVLRNMGILTEKMGNRKSALNYLKRSLKLAQQSGGKELEGLALRALGEIASTTMWDTSNVDGEDEAKVHFEKALVIFRAIGNEFEVARTLHAMGNRLLERGDLQAGRQHLEEAKSIFKRIESKVGDRIHRTIKEIKDDTSSSSSKLATRLKETFGAKTSRQEKEIQTDSTGNEKNKLGNE
jgi:tetratricopeptide (TPR) repeat protein